MLMIQHLGKIDKQILVFVLCSYKKPGRDAGFFVMRNLKDWISYTKKYPLNSLLKRIILYRSEMFCQETNSIRNYFPL
jgi:hypothetical protein